MSWQAFDHPCQRRLNGPKRPHPFLALSSFRITADNAVAFNSTATNLVAGDNGKLDVFVHDRDADGNGIFTSWEALDIR